MRKEERDQPVANLELRIDLEQVTSKLWRKSQWTYIPCSPSLYPSPSPSLPPLVEDAHSYWSSSVLESTTIIIIIPSFLSRG